MKFGILPFVLTFFFLFASRGFCQVGNELFNANDSTLPKPIFGIKIGANIQGITGNDWVSANNTGFMGGFYAGMHKKKVSVMLEILASTTRYKSKISIDTDGNIGDFNVTYLNVPLILEYNVIPHLSIQVGPQYNNILSVSKNSMLYADPKVVFKAGEFAGIIGLVAKLPHNFNVGARYIYGFSDINNQAFTSTQAWHEHALQITAGYTISK